MVHVLLYGLSSTPHSSMFLSRTVLFSFVLCPLVYSECDLRVELALAANVVRPGRVIPYELAQQLIVAGV